MNEFLTRSELVLGDDAMQRLAQTHVAVFGVGGVGGWCAEALVRTGVGAITIIDFDRVAASNVNRQIMATRSTVGELKVEVLAKRLAEINPDCKLAVRAERYAPETADSFDLSAFDCIVDAIDSVDCKALLIRRALATPDVTLYSSMGAALRRDPLRVRATPFKKVEGDGLARALRNRFRRDGGLPERDFTCVWSSEPPLASSGLSSERGSLVTVTAAFGLALAAQVIGSHPTT